jgi:putative DNA primase/helicase
MNREGKRSFDPARDISLLKHKIAEIGDVRLLIVDPIVSAISGDSHKNAEVRRGLQPLADLAIAARCALLGITHFTKGTAGRDPVERITGSLAFGALARVVLVAAKHQEESENGRETRLFCRAKSNIGPDDGGFEYDIHQAELTNHPGIFSSSVLWGASIEGTARELLATADATIDDGTSNALEDAKAFLTDLLKKGEVAHSQIEADVKGAGHSWATVRRAKTACGIRSVKKGTEGWFWKLPDEDAQTFEHVQVHRTNNDEHLEHLQKNHYESRPSYDSEDAHEIGFEHLHQNPCQSTVSGYSKGEGAQGAQSGSGENLQQNPGKVEIEI